MIYTVQHIAAVTNARLHAATGKDRSIEHLLTDSRKLTAPAGSLFFALQTPARNGHDFIADLYDRGVRAFVVREGFAAEGCPDAAFLYVPGVLVALHSLAAYHRSCFHLPVIGVTGSNGKTVVKEWLYELLEEDFTIVRSPKSYNSQIGVPLSIWEMTETHSLGIFEAGISARGEMEKLERIIRPAIGVITSLGEAHSAGFDSAAEKLEEKLLLFKDAEIVVGPYDLIGNLKSGVRLLSWGYAEEALIRIDAIEKEKEVTRIAVGYGQEKLRFTIPFTDEASVQNAITCLGVALCLGIDAAALLPKFSRLQPIDMRLQLKQSNNGCMVINDSYSADITSLRIALDFLQQQSGGLKRTVILSSFAESGTGEAELYEEIATLLRIYKIEKAVLIGEVLAAFVQPAVAAAMQVETYTSTQAFLAQVRLSQFYNEIILIKGARRAGFEEIAQVFEKKQHDTVLEINLNALAANIKEYRKLLRPGTKIMAMVKAFSYGSGSSEIAGVLQFHKVDYLGVAYADEGVELVKAGIYLPIMVMNTEASSFYAITTHNLQPVIYSFEILHLFEAYLKKEGLTYWPVHIEIETGMSRLGFEPAQVEALATHLSATTFLSVQSVFTHLAASEEESQDDFTGEQALKFRQAVHILQPKIPPFIRHISNSAAIVRHPALQMDMVRLGIGMYGIETDNEHKLSLEAVATLRSTIAQLKHLEKGESVSYNRRGRVARKSVIATVRIGYGDGYSRRFSNGGGHMWIRGKLVPVIGSVCMDMTMIDVTDVAGVKEGDDVIIFGTPLPVQQVAAWAGTIPYEIMTGIAQRVRRVYFHE